MVFTAEDALPAGTKVRYRLLGEVVGEESVNGTSWIWQPPTTDFKGYMAELYRQENGTDVIVGTIAVDVSSDPARFPRYGFVADFSREKTAEKTQEEMAYLNRHHIIGYSFRTGIINITGRWAVHVRSWTKYIWTSLTGRFIQVL